jgi:hypothetical protein
MSPIGQFQNVLNNVTIHETGYQSRRIVSSYSKGLNLMKNLTNSQDANKANPKLRVKLL